MNKLQIFFDGLSTAVIDFLSGKIAVLEYHDQFYNAYYKSRLFTWYIGYEEGVYVFYKQTIDITESYKSTFCELNACGDELDEIYELKNYFTTLFEHLDLSFMDSALDYLTHAELSDVFLEEYRSLISKSCGGECDCEHALISFDYWRDTMPDDIFEAYRTFLKLVCMCRLVSFYFGIPLPKMLEQVIVTKLSGL